MVECFLTSGGESGGEVGGENWVDVVESALVGVGPAESDTEECVPTIGVPFTS